MYELARLIERLVTENRRRLSSLHGFQREVLNEALFLGDRLVCEMRKREPAREWVHPELVRFLLLLGESGAWDEVGRR